LQALKLKKMTSNQNLKRESQEAQN
jgi:hypothetical protein